MKPNFNLSFSNDENRVEYQYKPTNSTMNFESLSIFPLYQKSLSSSFLPIPHLNSLSLNSSISLMGNEYENIKNKLSSSSSIKVQNNTKEEFAESIPIAQLNLDFLLQNKKISTKNVLRNFGNAQNQYILYNNNIQEALSELISNKQQFQSWIRKLKLINFQDYKNIWMISGNQSHKEKIFKKIYKKLCWKFYQEESIPYIFNSRLNNESKKSHILQIYKMLRGIMDPKNFDGFKE